MEDQTNYGKPKERYILTVDMYLYSDDPLTDMEIAKAQIEKFTDNVTDVEVLTVDVLPFGGKRSENIYTKKQ